MVVFGLTLAVAAGTPGPATTALVGRTLAGDIRAGSAFGLGLLTGDLIWLSGALLGVTVLMRTAGWAFVVLQLCGAAYLFWLAWTAWGSEQQQHTSGAGAAVTGGLLVALSNPKTMLFYLALLPGLLSLEQLRPSDWLVAGLVVTVVYGAVLAIYIGLARYIRDKAGPGVAGPMNRISAIILAATAIYILSRV